jgi:outer membrane protein TolC
LYFKILLIVVCLCVGDFVFAQTALLPTPPMPKPVRTAPRAVGQKYIDEIWQELEDATFATPTFDELGTLHEGYSFDEIWQLARYSNPSIRQKANLIAAARGQQIQSGLYTNPIISYSADNVGINGEIGKHTLGVSQAIITSKKKKLDRRIATHDVVTAQKEYTIECKKLYNDLRIAHNEMLHAILICKVEKFAQEMNAELLKVAKELQNGNKERALDVLQFQITLNEGALTYKQAENYRIAKWHNLIAIAGTPNLPYKPVRGSLIDHSPKRDWQTIWYQFQNSSPQLELARIKIAKAKSQLSREKAEQIPNFVATFTLSRDVPAKTNVPFFGVAAPLKLFDNNQGNIATASTEIAIANREMERLTLLFHKRLADVFCQYDNACELIQVYEKSIIPDSFEVLRDIGENYFNGKMSHHELYEQRQLVIRILLQYIQSLKIKAITTTQIDGMLLEGTLE